MIDFIVTGATGFIGNRLLNELKLSGLQVIGLGSKDGDVASIETWKNLPSARVVIHLAGLSYVPESWDNSSEFMKTNIIGTEHALMYCRKHGARFVMASAYLYGIPQNMPITEKDVVRPNNPYALSKYLAEQLAGFSYQYHQFPVTVLRIFNVFGPGQREDFLIPTIIDQALNKKAIRLQDLNPRRDYVYVDDVVDAFILASQLEEGYNLMNIGSGKSHSVAEVVQIAQMILGTNFPVVSEKRVRPQEIPEVIADIELAEKILGWTPKIALEEGLRKMIRGYEYD